MAGVEHRSQVPAGGPQAGVAQEAAAAEATAAADRRLDLLGNQMGRIALAVSAVLSVLYYLFRR